MGQIGLRRLNLAIAAAALAWALPQAPARAQASDPFIGQLMLVPYGFCPRGWTEAEGQILPINQYTALFSLVGTTYGGNGQTTFGLPDLRGRAPIHVGQGPGLSNYVLGQAGGKETATLSISQLPPHSHQATTSSTLHATDAQADQNVPTNHVLGDDGTDRIYSAAQPNVAMSSAAVTSTTAIDMTGSGTPVEIRGPFLTMRWCIALNGVFPSRN